MKLNVVYLVDNSNTNHNIIQIYHDKVSIIISVSAILVTVLLCLVNIDIDGR